MSGLTAPLRASDGPLVWVSGLAGYIDVWAEFNL